MTCQPQTSSYRRCVVAVNVLHSTKSKHTLTLCIEYFSSCVLLYNILHYAVPSSQHRVSIRYHSIVTRCNMIIKQSLAHCIPSWLFLIPLSSYCRSYRSKSSPLADGTRTYLLLRLDLITWVTILWQRHLMYQQQLR